MLNTEDDSPAATATARCGVVARELEGSSSWSREETNAKIYVGCLA